MTAKVNTSASAIAGNSGGSAANNKKKKKAADPCTLFVKFTPPSANITRQHLSNYFSYWGPVNKCSVIRNKQAKYQQQQQHDGDGGEDDDNNNNNNNTSGDRGSKGYGFVRFVNEEDAISAANANDIKSYNNNNNKKKNSKKGNNSNGGEEYMVVEGVQYKIHAERAVDASSATASSANNTSQQQHQKKKEKETEIANKVTPPPNNNKVINSTAAPPSSSSSSSSTTAAPIDADTLYKKESKRKRTSRVIIRNLSFYANATHVKTIMESNFGPVSAVDLPLVPDIISQSSPDDSNSNNNNKKKNPRHRGFAFVTFTNSNAAKLAVEHTGSEIQIKNRVVAIDFSVSKAEHQKMMREDRESKGKNDDDDGDSESDSDSDSESGEKTEEKVDGNSSDSGSEDSSDSSDSDSDNGDSESEDEGEHEKTATKDDTSAHEDEETPTPPQFDDGESKRTLFLRNVPFDATRHDVFELFRTFGRIQAVYLVKDRVTGVFKGTAFVRFENEEGCMAVMEASGAGEKDCDDQQQHFVSSKNMAMSGGASSSSLTLKGRTILIDLAVDRTTASSLAIQRDEEGKPIKKMVGKDRRNIYLKNEGRVSSSTDSGHAQEASAKHGGMWEDLPPSDRAKRERAFADKSTKLRSPLFFINPTRISVRNLAKHINEAQLKTLVFGALKTGLKEGLVTPKDAVSHWRAGGELPHAEVMRRATDPKLVTPPLDEKNMKEAIPSLYIDRDVSGGKKTADAPSRGFGFVEFTHHIHALAVLRQLNNNPMYSSEYAAGGKHASEMSKQKRGKKKKGGKSKTKVDPETGDEFLSEDGKVVVPRLIVEFAVENKAKARQQAEKVAQKKANKIKQRIEKKEKQKEQSTEKKKEKEKKKGRGALQREKKRARKEAGEDDTDTKKDADENVTKKQKLDTKTDKIQEKKPKMVKPKKKRKVDADEEVLEDMIRSYKSTFSQASESTGKGDHAESKASEPKKRSREEVVKKRWFE